MKFFTYCVMWALHIEHHLKHHHGNYYLMFCYIFFVKFDLNSKRIVFFHLKGHVACISIEKIQLPGFKTVANFDIRSSSRLKQSIKKRPSCIGEPICGRGRCSWNGYTVTNNRLRENSNKPLNTDKGIAPASYVSQVYYFYIVSIQPISGIWS